jgi:glycosidase
MTHRRCFLIFVIVLALLSGCTQATPTPALIPQPTPTPAATPTASPTSHPLITPVLPIAGGLQPHWWDKCVFYVILVRSFYDANGDGYGDLQGLMDKLDYLNDGNPNTDTDLGVTALWLMPVYRSAAYHGYAATDYYNIEPDYGDNETFRRLVSEAHKRGIYVIVDTALNHTSEKHIWFLDAITSPSAEHRNWYIWSDTDPGWRAAGQRQVWFERNGAYYFAFFGPALPDLNLRNEATTVQVLDVIRFWLQDMGVDGFRLDAIRHLIEEGQNTESTPSTHAWLRRFYQFYKGIQPNAFAIGEVTGSAQERLSYYGDQVDMCFEFDWMSAAVSSLTDGDPAAIRTKQGLLQSVYPQNQYGIFLALQDHNRILSQLGESLPKARLAATLLLTSPGVPFMFYGEEIGMRGNKPDIYIRRPMQWENKRGAGFSAGRPWMEVDLNYDQVNVASESADPESLLSHYRRLVRLRSQYEALSIGSWLPLEASNRQVYAYLRHVAAADVLVILNFSDQAITQCSLTASKSDIPAGKYTPRDLLGKQSIAPLSVNATGSFSSYVPLPSLEPLTGYVVLIR